MSFRIVCMHICYGHGHRNSIAYNSLLKINYGECKLVDVDTKIIFTNYINTATVTVTNKLRIHKYNYWQTNAKD